MQWYYAENNKPVGPITEEQFQQAVMAGKVTAQTMVWHEGMTNWVAFGSIAGPQTTTPPPPPEQPAVATPVPTGTCTECGKVLPVEDLIKFDTRLVCANCKPAFFQRIQEGAVSAGRTPNRELAARARGSLQGAWWFAFGCILLLNFIRGVAGSMPYCIGFIISMILGGAFELGNTTFLLNMARKGRPGSRFSMIFDGFLFFGEALVLFLVYALLLSLWSLPASVFALAGIIAFAAEKIALGAIFIAVAVPLITFPVVYGYAYSMAFYVLANEKGLRPFDIIKRSKKMMIGRKFKLFCLQVRFLGWSILASIPFFAALGAIILMMVNNPNLPDENVGAFFGMIGVCVVTFFISWLGWAFIQVYMGVATAHFYDDVKDRALDMTA